ncbi:MAG: RHS repeat-associated core domain-containing protein [Eubacterium sp.]|nr:RHS repeat-associated core domain-containing protein [Eubacterium sp.]
MAVRALKGKLKTSKSLPQVLSSCTLCNLTVGTEIGTRYRYIDDTPLVPLSEAAAGGGSSAAAGGAKTRSRASSEYVLYSHGAPAAVNSDDGTSYFGTDILGSVRNVTDKYGAVQSSYNYDAFGSPYLGNLDNGMSFGYTGKAYDAGTGLYDYGFRDYSPVSARFTTIDPIRDGSNWFSYVVNDPVNYVDLFGLQVTAVTPVAGQSSTYLPGGGTNFNGSARGVDQYLASKKETDEWVGNAAGHLYNIAKGDWLDDVLYIWDKMTGEKRKEAYKEYQLNFDMQYMQHKQDMKDSGLFDYNNDGRYSEQEASAFAKALNGTYMAPETLAKIRPYKIDTHQMTDREAYEYLNRVEKDSVAISNKLVNEMNSNPANSIPLIMPNITRNTANEESDNKTIINNVIQGLVSISPVINLYSSVSIGCAK